jgi:signal transduction histidine kinase
MTVASNKIYGSSEPKAVFRQNGQLSHSLSSNESEEKTYPGLGIGLYISFDIIKRHGGQVWVESQKGKGSTFHFALPLVKEERR